MTFKLARGVTITLVLLFLLNRPAPSWGAFQSLGGVIVGDPSCANSGFGIIACAAKGTNNALFGIRFNPSSFSTGFQSLGGIIVGNPSCASPNGGAGPITCAAKGTNNALFGIRFNPLSFIESCKK
jgi:hypothetical protein